MGEAIKELVSISNFKDKDIQRTPSNSVLRFLTFDTSDQSDEETSSDQQKENDKNKDKDKDRDKDKDKDKDKKQ